jgi:hypothetical protein
MTTNNGRFARQIPLLGAEGQIRLRSSRVAVVGIGGLGTHVVQQLALLGVGKLTLIDSEELADTNRNRYVSARHDDPIPGTRKVDIGERLALSFDPTVQVEKVFDTVISDDAFALIKSANCVFGCVDREGTRLILNELCAAYDLRYLDLASEVIPGNPSEYGGRVCVAWNRPGCLVCYDEIDLREAQEDLAGPIGEEQRRVIYGVDASALGRTGPSVVSINGVVASLAITEFMVGVTGVRMPKGLLTYRGSSGKVTVPGGDSGLPRPDCYYCGNVRGQGNSADVERYIREGVGTYLR